MKVSRSVVGEKLLIGTLAVSEIFSPILGGKAASRSELRGIFDLMLPQPITRRRGYSGVV
jgi:hypothetical protein